MITCPPREVAPAPTARWLAPPLVALWLALASWPVQALEKVRTFTQTNYPGFIQYTARELGLFTKYGIDPDLRFFPSGAPIVQAAAADGWDIAFLGAPPAVIGATTLGMVTIGVLYDESVQHKLIGRPDFVAQVEADPQRLKGAKIFVTTLSTGHYVAEACLRKFGLAPGDVSIIPSEQSATLAAFSAGQGDLAQAWPPFTLALLERGNRVLCDGQQAGVEVATVWVAAKSFAARHPDLVVKWLKANGEAIDWIRQDPVRTTQMYRKFMASVGQSASESTLRDVVRFVMDAHTLQQQIGFMTAHEREAPYILRMYDGIARFFIRNGRLREVPDFKPFVDASFLARAVQP
jgi:ABC-type nitrate/sulfonate/bicarbonate transport system substrate-binding protein